jgi:glycosyltransferase involved in cell wall biosynthesis
MSAAPSIAVIIPVRNGMPWLEETLSSVRSQNREVELAVVDDGSTDSTRDYLRSLNGFCTHFLELDGRGPSAARNAGIRATNSEFVAFLDADDLWPAGTLDVLAQALAEHPECGIAQGLIQNFRIGPEGLKDVFTAPYRFLNLGACLWRRSVFETVGMLDEGLLLCEDLDLLMRCWEKDVRKTEVNAVVLLYRRHPGNMTHGLSGAGFGTVKAYKRRIDRIRSGQYDPATTRHCDPNDYLGAPPPSQDGV